MFLHFFLEQVSALVSAVLCDLASGWMHALDHVLMNLSRFLISCGKATATVIASLNHSF
jgi:hypothetical protein